jgi:L-alanine-DL-glutamate epimerase-like enolase superfamily enzyme
VLPVAAPAVVARMLDRAAALGMRQIKLKAAPELAHDLVNARAAGERVAGAEVRIDANAAWSPATARAHIPALQAAGVVSFEQPLAAAPPEAYVELAASLPRPARVVVDESVWHERHVQWFMKHGGAAGVNLKVGKHGGLLPASRLHRLLRAAGMTCQLGAHVGESSLLASAGAALAALTGDLEAHEGCAGLLLLEHDVTQEPLMFGTGGVLDVGRLQTRPGLGVAVDEQLVARATRATRCWG